jgi:L-lactate dehydrogenase complex protein LldG
MSSRAAILAAVKANQPALKPLPATITFTEGSNFDFTKILEGIGGKVIALQDESVVDKIQELFPGAKRIVSVADIGSSAELQNPGDIAYHSLEDADVVIIKAAFGVAENGAVWLSENEYKIRVLPFIGENLVILLQKDAIVQTMQQAYQRIGSLDYGFGVFIAGPSKTADIEQCLVLGAHGPKTMTIFLM